MSIQTDTTNSVNNSASTRRGFASMDSAKQKEIASRGGKAAHATGRAHEFTSDEARAAGRKGGERVSRDRAHMAAIGRIGGMNRGRNKKLREAAAAAAQSHGTTSTAHSAEAPAVAE
jgi:general stress protein YciG